MCVNADLQNIEGLSTILDKHRIFGQHVVKLLRFVMLGPRRIPPVLVLDALFSQRIGNSYVAVGAVFKLNNVIAVSTFCGFLIATIVTIFFELVPLCDEQTTHLLSTIG